MRTTDWAGICGDTAPVEVEVFGLAFSCKVLGLVLKAGCLSVSKISTRVGSFLLQAQGPNIATHIKSLGFLHFNGPPTGEEGHGSSL